MQAAVDVVQGGRYVRHDRNELCDAPEQRGVTAPVAELVSELGAGSGVSADAKSGGDGSSGSDIRHDTCVSGVSAGGKSGGDRSSGSDTCEPHGAPEPGDTAPLSRTGSSAAVFFVSAYRFHSRGVTQFFSPARDERSAGSYSSVV